MLNSWFSNPYHRLTIHHPSISKLFCKLDEELLIGVKPQNYFVLNSSVGCSGIYTDILSRDWDYGEVV